MTPKWKVCFGRATPSRPIFDEVEVEAWTGASAEEIAKEMKPGWRLLSSQTKKISGSYEQVG
jgi:hypothetical protein